MGLGTVDAQTWEKIWGGIGLVGQGAFTARFLVQWLASERKRETVMPVAFWWFSLAGGLITLTYVIHLGSLSLTLGQSMGLIVYVRNLMLVKKARRREAKRRQRAAGRRTQRIDAANSVVGCQLSVVGPPSSTNSSQADSTN